MLKPWTTIFEQIWSISSCAFDAKIEVTEICTTKEEVRERLLSWVHDEAIAKAFRATCKRLTIGLPKKWKIDEERALGEKIRNDLLSWNSVLASIFMHTLDSIKFRRKKETVETKVLEEFLQEIGWKVEEWDSLHQKIRMQILGTLNIYPRSHWWLLFDYESMRTEPRFIEKLKSIPPAARFVTLEHEARTLVKDYTRETVEQFLDAAIRESLIQTEDKEKLLS